MQPGLGNSGTVSCLGCSGHTVILHTRQWGKSLNFLLFGVDCRSPTEAAYLPVGNMYATTMANYQEELMVSLSSAHNLAQKTIQQIQAKYKQNYDCSARKTAVATRRVDPIGSCRSPGMAFIGLSLGRIQTCHVSKCTFQITPRF